MKRTNFFILVMSAFIMLAAGQSFAQDANSHVVNIQKIRVKWPENGTATERDSLVAIYNANVINKNEHILSHREYAHFFTGDNRDYVVIQEYKDLVGMEASFLRTTELENKAWPDEMKRKEFFNKLDSYFETWHADGLYHTNTRLSKN